MFQFLIIAYLLPFSPLQTIDSFNFGHVRMYLTPCRISIIFTHDSVLLYRQIVGSSMGKTCLPHAADLFFLCYERDFITSFSDDNQADIIEASYSTSRYLDDLLNMDTPYSKQYGQTNLST